MFSGTITALITPFRNGALDEERLHLNIEYQITSGISGLLALGTTGELSTLTPCEQQRVIEAILQAADKRIPVLVNAGDNSTQSTIEKVQLAEALGADGVLIIVPYYNKPPQEGIIRHFAAIAKETSLPIIIYNNPSRVGTMLTRETANRLAEIEGVVAIKESSGSIPFASGVRGMTLLSGDDVATLPLIALGAQGVISVLSNAFPEEMIALTQAALSGNFAQALAHHKALEPLFDAMGVDSNPIPIKYAMSLLGLASDEVRLPLCELTPESKRKIEQAMRLSSV